jgi:rSAM/selenodomain-associated transferase 1
MRRHVQFTIYKLLAEGIMKNIFPKNPGMYDVYIFFTPYDKENQIKAWIKPLINNARGRDVQYIPQEGYDLGERMSYAFKQMFRNKGYKRCTIIGTDCPGIDATLIENAFKILKEKDVVIGPCRDGGYYLLGMSTLAVDLFVNIDWSTDRVFNQTIEKTQKNNLSSGILTTLVDIDTQEDIRCLPKLF